MIRIGSFIFNINTVRYIEEVDDNLIVHLKSFDKITIRGVSIEDIQQCI